MCSWQFDGQCSIASVHVNLDAARVPSWRSVPVPVTEKGSPTDQVVVAAGPVMVAVGAVPTLMTLNAVSVSPPAVTFSPTVTLPGEV